MLILAPQSEVVQFGNGVIFDCLEYLRFKIEDPCESLDEKTELVDVLIERASMFADWIPSLRGLHLDWTQRLKHSVQQKSVLINWTMTHILGDQIMLDDFQLYWDVTEDRWPALHVPSRYI